MTLVGHVICKLADTRTFNRYIDYDSKFILLIFVMCLLLGTEESVSIL
jgi:hypothetical protein